LIISLTGANSEQRPSAPCGKEALMRKRLVLH
jgi:hypothetical protein